MTNSLNRWIIMFIAFAMFGQIANAQNCSSMSALAVFEGSWQEVKQNQTTLEIWLKVSENSLEGSGSVLDAEGDITSFESLRIVLMSEEIFYLAKVTHNEFPTPFKLTKCDQNKFEFENSNHDFPKRITYLFVGPESLKVTVSGENDNGFQIAFQKVTSK